MDMENRHIEELDTMVTWKETHRHLIGIRVHDDSKYAYAEAVYDVYKTDGVQTRSIVTPGKPIYLHEHPELLLAFAVAIPVLKEFTHVCTKVDGYQRP